MQGRDIACKLHGITVHQTGRDICADSPIITRVEWEARDTKSVELLEGPVGLVFVHHTAMSECFNFDECAAEMRKIQDFHMDIRGWDDIGYSFLVGEDGSIYEARGWRRVGAHTRGWNSVSLAISIMGDFTEKLPAKLALDSVRKLIKCGVDRGYIRPDYKLYGHKDTNPNTTCPGDILYEEIQTWPEFGPLPPVHPKNT